MSGLLDGENVSLTLVTKAGLGILLRWFNDPECTRARISLILSRKVYPEIGQEDNPLIPLFGYIL